MKKLGKILKDVGGPEHYLFNLEDIAPVFPELTKPALKMLLGRAVSDGLLQRVCRNIYIDPDRIVTRGTILYRIAAKLRAGSLNYVSLESVLSDAGVISQVPFQWLTLMSSGRSSLIDCGQWGTIEFVHTDKEHARLANVLVYDETIRFWRAPVALAIREMKACHRPLDLIDWRIADEFV